MAETLILDSEAVNALARPKQRGALAERTRAILTIANERKALVRVPAPVLAEVFTGQPHDAALNHLLQGRGIEVVELTRDMAQRAGTILTKAGCGSQHAVDAFVVATALAFKSAVIATGDPIDIRKLAAPFRNLSVFPI